MTMMMRTVLMETSFDGSLWELVRVGVKGLATLRFVLEHGLDFLLDVFSFKIKIMVRTWF